MHKLLFLKHLGVGVRDFSRHKLCELGQHRLITNLVFPRFDKGIFHPAFGHVGIKLNFSLFDPKILIGLDVKLIITQVTFDYCKSVFP